MTSCPAPLSSPRRVCGQRHLQAKPTPTLENGLKGWADGQCSGAKGPYCVCGRAVRPILQMNMLRFSERGNCPFDPWSVISTQLHCFPPRLSGQTTRAGIWQRWMVWTGPQPLPCQGIWSAAPSPLPPSTLQCPPKRVGSLLTSHLLTKGGILLEGTWADLRVGEAPGKNSFLREGVCKPTFAREGRGGVATTVLGRGATTFSRDLKAAYDVVRRAAVWE